MVFTGNILMAVCVYIYKTICFALDLMQVCS